MVHTRTTTLRAVVFIRPFEKQDVLCYGVWRPSVNFFVSG